MPSYCCAIKCNNSSAGDKSISFHSFPLKDKKLLSIWLAKIKREDFDPTRHTKICSDHFEPECFTIQMFSGRRLLKPGSVPTKFSFTKENSRDMNSYQRRYVLNNNF